MFFLFILVFISITIVSFSLYTGISPQPTNRKTKKVMLELIPADFSGKIVDLGAGFGTLVLSYARRYPACEIIAYEISPFPCFVLLLIKTIFHFRNLRVVRKNFLKESLAEADLVLCYLCPKQMSLLSKKLNHELKVGTVIISNTFSLPNWQAEKVLRVDDLYSSNVFVYCKYGLP